MIYKKESIKERIRDQDLLKLNKTYTPPNGYEELLKIVRVINSCETIPQLSNTHKWITTKIESSRKIKIYYSFVHLILENKLNDLIKSTC